MTTGGNTMADSTWPGSWLRSHAERDRTCWLRVLTSSTLRDSMSMPSPSIGRLAMAVSRCMSLLRSPRSGRYQATTRIPFARARRMSDTKRSGSRITVSASHRVAWMYTVCPPSAAMRSMSPSPTAPPPYVSDQSYTSIHVPRPAYGSIVNAPGAWSAVTALNVAAAGAGAGGAVGGGGGAVVVGASVVGGNVVVVVVVLDDVVVVSDVEVGAAWRGAATRWRCRASACPARAMSDASEVAAIISHSARRKAWLFTRSTHA